MTPSLRHCPKCGTLQADRPRCGRCGARLAAAGDSLSLREIGGLAGTLVVFLGSFVLVAVAIVFLLLWMLG